MLLMLPARLEVVAMPKHKKLGNKPRHIIAPQFIFTAFLINFEHHFQGVVCPMNGLWRGIPCVIS